MQLRIITLGFAFTAGLLAAGFDWNLPAGFPPPAVPSDNPMSDAKVELGRFLFYDKRISFNGKESCGSCHRQELAFTDGRAHAEGTTGQLHPRSSMSLVNVAYAAYLTWANPALTSLEEQALTPMLGEDPVELGMKGHESEFLQSIGAEPVYQRLFPQAFPEETDLYTLRNVTKAIAAFERTIISVRSPYDRYRWGGDLSAISGAAKRGELIFVFQRARGLLSVPWWMDLQRGHPIRRDQGFERQRRRAQRFLQYRRLHLRRAQPWRLRTDSQSGRYREIPGTHVAKHRRHRALHARWQHSDPRGSDRPLRLWGQLRRSQQNPHPAPVFVDWHRPKRSCGIPEIAHGRAVAV
jgi:hypothetical protein